MTTSGARRTAEGADGARHARQGACRVGQPLRRRHDRADRLLLGLLRHARLRRAADARHRLPLSPVLSAAAAAPHRPGRHPAGEHRPPRAGRSRAWWATCGATLEALLPLLEEKRDGAHLDAGAASIIARPARSSTTWRSARRASGRSTRSRSPRRSATRLRRTPSSPAMSVCRRCGPRAISR